MKIKTRLQINTLLSLMAAILIAITLYFNFIQLNFTIQKTRSANEIIKDVFELNLVTNEYILHHDQRPKSQWLLKEKSLEKILNITTFDSQEEQIVMKRLKNGLIQMKEIFMRLIKDDGIKKTDVDKIVEERLISLLLIRSENFVTDAFILSEISNIQVIESRRTFNMLIFILTIATPLVVIINSLVFNKRVIKPIEKLSLEVENIGKGNIEYKSEINTNDEIGNLARAFSQMTERLNHTTVSMDMLLKEVEERKKIDKIRQEITEQLSYSNRELEQFAYVASHDLQEPLRMVSSYCKLLERRYKDKLDEDANEFISFAVEGANRMHSLLEALLSYSRVGTKKIDFKLVDCNEILKATKQNLHESIVEKNVNINITDLPKIIGDENQLIQLFQNLIFNAIKYKSEEDPVINISCEKQDYYWHFSIKDNGIGIDQSHTERIFIIFQRLHTRSEYSGMGIGLAICKKIVERHKGNIWVESEGIGKGSTFHFTIPA